MKYRVTTTTADHVNGHTYGSARAALKVYNNIRDLYRRLGYTIADAGNGHNCRAELWKKDGREDRNIEIWPIAPKRATARPPRPGYPGRTFQQITPIYRHYPKLQNP